MAYMVYVGSADIFAARTNPGEIVSARRHLARVLPAVCCSGWTWRGTRSTYTFLPRVCRVPRCSR